MPGKIRLAGFKDTLNIEFNLERHLKPPTQPSIQRVTGADNSGGKESEEQS
jgi:hypothetical protein